MSSPDGHASDAGSVRRALAIDQDEPCWALISRDPPGPSSHWLNLKSGEWLFLAEPGALDEAAEDPLDTEPWLRIEAIESSDACGNFKDTPADHPSQREAGFAFERHAMRTIARRWREEHAIAPTWGAHKRPPSG